MNCADIMKSAWCGQKPEEVGAILHQPHDDIPRTPARAVVLYRTQKPAASFGATAEAAFVTVLSKQDKSHLVLGFARNVSVLAVHDGSSDHFQSMPPHVKKNFKSLQDLKRMMKVDGSCKLYAIVLEEFEPKGTHTYEVSGIKLRTGFGKTQIELIPPSSGSLADKKAFFGVGQSESSVGPRESIEPDSSHGKAVEHVDATDAVDPTKTTDNVETGVAHGSVSLDGDAVSMKSAHDDDQHANTPNSTDHCSRDDIGQSADDVDGTMILAIFILCYSMS